MKIIKYNSLKAGDILISGDQFRQKTSGKRNKDSWTNYRVRLKDQEEPLSEEELRRTSWRRPIFKKKLG